MTAYAHNLRRLKRAPQDSELRRNLEQLLTEVDRARLLRDDPVSLVHGYQDPHDQEVAGLIVAGLAYGRVASIKKAAGEVLARLGPRPAQALNAASTPSRLDGFVYRFQKGEDLPRFVRAIGRVRKRSGSLARAFASQLRPNNKADDYSEAAARFVGVLREEMGVPPSYGLRYLVPDPSTGGAAKRLWLYLRWMVRGPDGLDLGTWRSLCTELDPACLVVPLDTHISRLARYLGLTRRMQDDLTAAREITARFRALHPQDPLRYDMALCHLGISGGCPRQLDLEKCRACPIRAVCRVKPVRVRSPQRP